MYSRPKFLAINCSSKVDLVSSSEQISYPCGPGASIVTTYTSQCYKSVVENVPGPFGTTQYQVYKMEECGTGCCKTVWNFTSTGPIPSPPEAIGGIGGCSAYVSGQPLVDGVCYVLGCHDYTKTIEGKEKKITDSK